MAITQEPQEIPTLIPVFPLTGSLLLPGNLLPLNIFEPRYRNMVEDALAGGQHIGMIQPLVPRQDNWVAEAESASHPDLYPIGCVGKIERSEKQLDGRYLIVLRGISRFRIVRELPMWRGYRQVEADYTDFPGDESEPSSLLNPARLLHALRTFSEKHGLEFDFDLLGSLPGVILLNGLAAALPFRPAEKQALLEAPGTLEREELLLTLMGMGLDTLSTDEYYSPPTVH
ncbi:MAG: LON peptidase substrate-binding domain-containing protein [Acidobacteriota bacterium]